MGCGQMDADTSMRHVRLWLMLSLIAVFVLPVTGVYAQKGYTFSLASGYYEYFLVNASAGQNLTFTVLSNASLSVYVFNSQGFAAFSSTGLGTTLFNVSGTRVEGSVGPLQTGEYYLVADNYGGTLAHVAVWYGVEPLSVYYLDSKLPAPVGIADYGVRVVNDTLKPYTVKYDEVYGYADISQLEAYNATPPANISMYGASLQLNAVFQVNMVDGARTYWLQNVASFYTNNQTLEYVDNVWNQSSNTSIMASDAVDGGGGVSEYGGETVYAYGTPLSQYTFPLYLTLVVKTGYSESEAYAAFGYFNGSAQPVWYDNVTIRQPGVVSAYMLIEDTNLTARETYYDAELVFGGQDSGEFTSFNALSASLALDYVLLNGSIEAPVNLYGFGSDTVEAAYNLVTYMENGVPHTVVGTVQGGFHSLGTPSTEVSGSSNTTFGDGVAHIFANAWGKPPYTYTVELNGQIVAQKTTYASFLNLTIPASSLDEVTVSVGAAPTGQVLRTQTAATTTVSGQTRTGYVENSQSTVSTTWSLTNNTAVVGSSTSDLVVGGVILILIIFAVVAVPITLSKRRR
jgi:thermopsin